MLLILLAIAFLKVYLITFLLSGSSKGNTSGEFSFSF